METEEILIDEETKEKLDAWACLLDMEIENNNYDEVIVWLLKSRL